MVHVGDTARDPIAEDKREKKQKGRVSALPGPKPAPSPACGLPLGFASPLSRHGEKSPSGFHSAESAASLQASSGLAGAWDLLSGPTPPRSVGRNRSVTAITGTVCKEGLGDLHTS